MYHSDEFDPPATGTKVNLDDTIAVFTTTLHTPVFMPSDPFENKPFIERMDPINEEKLCDLDKMLNLRSFDNESLPNLSVIGSSMLVPEPLSPVTIVTSPAVSEIFTCGPLPNPVAVPTAMPPPTSISNPTLNSLLQTNIMRIANKIVKNGNGTMGKTIAAIVNGILYGNDLGPEECQEGCPHMRTDDSDSNSDSDSNDYPDYYRNDLEWEPCAKRPKITPPLLRPLPPQPEVIVVSDDSSKASALIIEPPPCSPPLDIKGFHDLHWDIIKASTENKSKQNPESPPHDPKDCPSGKEVPMLQIPQPQPMSTPDDMPVSEEVLKPVSRMDPSVHVSVTMNDTRSSAGRRPTPKRSRDVAITPNVATIPIDDKISIAYHGIFKKRNKNSKKKYGTFIECLDLPYQKFQDGMIKSTRTTPDEIRIKIRIKPYKTAKIRIKPEKSGNPSWDIDLGNFRKLGQDF